MELIRKYSIGTIVNECTIIDYDIDKHNYILKCNICGRIKSVSSDRVVNMSYHKKCGYLLKDVPMHFRYKWENMRQRTTNPNANGYADYGGRGINSDDYEYFVDFYDDLFESYKEHVELFGEKDTTIDRIDCDGDYKKENIRWATRKEQNENLHSTIKVIVTDKETGEIKYEFNSLNDCGTFFEVSCDTIRRRAKNQDVEYDNEKLEKYTFTFERKYQ